jgi:hypothetical protein
MVPEAEFGLPGNSDLDLLILAAEARAFLLSKKWCGGIEAIYFDRGFSHVAVFLAEVQPLHGADPQVWVIVGDIPPAYMDTYYCLNGAEALAGYVGAFSALLDAYETGDPLTDEIPLLQRASLAPLALNDDLAARLRSRLRIIDKMVEEWKDEIRTEVLDLEG